MSIANRVSGVMSPHPVVLRPFDTAERARDLFVEYGFTIAPVVDASGHLCGVVCAGDLIERVAPDAERRTLLGDMMTRDPVTIRRSATVADAARLMAVTGTHHLVVVDPGPTPVGVISTIDVARAMADGTFPQPVRWVMSPEVLTIDVGTTLAEARRELEDWGVTTAVVVDQGSPVGALSHLSLLRAEEEDEEVSPEDSVDTVMDRAIRSVGEDTSIEEAARLVAEEEVRRILVMDGDMDIVGIVTATDLAHFVGRLIDLDGAEEEEP